MSATRLPRSLTSAASASTAWAMSSARVDRQLRHQGVWKIAVYYYYPDLVQDFRVLRPTHGSWMRALVCTSPGMASPQIGGAVAGPGTPLG
jgi:hypothetical protein